MQHEKYEEINEMFEEMKMQTYSRKEQEEKIAKAKDKAVKLGKVAGDFLLLIKMIKDYWKGDFKITKKDLAIIIAAIVYVANPIDVVPDFIPIVGFLDDASVVGFVIQKLYILIREYKRFRG